MIATLNEITKFISASAEVEGKDSAKWGGQSVVMGGKIYRQTSGIFNMIFNYDHSYMTNFSAKTADKYESIFGGSSISSSMAKLEATGHDTSSYMPFVNAALNEDWEGVKGFRKVFVDSIT